MSSYLLGTAKQNSPIITLWKVGILKSLKIVRECLADCLDLPAQVSHLVKQYANPIFKQ